MRALRQLLRRSRLKFESTFRAFATIFDVHMPRQLNGLPAHSLRFTTGNFSCVSRKIAAIQTLNGSRQCATIAIDTWARSASNTLKSSSTAAAQSLAGKTQDVIVAPDGAGMGHRPPNALRYHSFWADRCALTLIAARLLRSLSQLKESDFTRALRPGLLHWSRPNSCAGSTTK
jgi:hypothetical protein